MVENCNCYYLKRKPSSRKLLDERIPLFIKNEDLEARVCFQRGDQHVDTLMRTSFSNGPE
jgi:hypothetical protein